jgi:hypothetical protein
MLIAYFIVLKSGSKPLANRLLLTTDSSHATRRALIASRSLGKRHAIRGFVALK